MGSDNPLRIGDVTVSDSAADSDGPYSEVSLEVNTAVNECVAIANVKMMMNVAPAPGSPDHWSYVSRDNGDRGRRRD